MRQSGNPRRTKSVIAPYQPYETVKSGGALVLSSPSTSRDGAGGIGVPTMVSGLNLSNAGLSVLRLPSNLFFITELYIQKNSLSLLPSALGQLHFLRVLDASYNSLTTLPIEMGNLFELRDLNVSCNRLTELPVDIFGRLHRLESCQHDGNNLVSPPHDVLAGGAYAIFRYCCDSMSAPPPPDRLFHHFVPEIEQSHMLSQGHVKINVLCYNVLAELYATAERHGYCPMWALAWSYRKMRILSEIMSLAADVICLQEVETQQYHDFFAPSLAGAGYDGAFQAKSRARSMAESGRVDGCAIFWRRGMFVAVEEHVLEFQNEAGLRSEEFQGEGLNRLILKGRKDNVALIVLLEMWSTRQRLLVANTHIHWDPSFADVKLIQTKMFLEKLSDLHRQHNRVPLLIAGDFNSTPDSGVFDLITKGWLPPEHKELKSHSYYGEYTEKGMSHELGLSSAYPSVTPYTNCTHEFRGVLDYIFCQRDAFRVASVLAVLPLEQLPFPALPNAHFPSDHVALFASVFLR